MVIGLSGLPGPVASCRIALPLEVTRIVMCVERPIILPSQEPARVFSFSNAFCASDCGPDVFGIGISCGNTTAAAATRMIRSVSFRIGSPFSSTVNTHKLSMAETNEHDATISAGYPKALLDFAVSRGADRQVLIERSQIRLDDLKDQDNRIPLASYLALIKAG